MKKITVTVLIMFFTSSFAAQEFAINQLKFNILYAGVNNYLNIVVENYDCDELLIKTTAPIKHEFDCSYMIHPKKIQPLMISIHAVKNGDTIYIGCPTYTVLPLPAPHATIGQKPGFIHKNFLAAQMGLRAENGDFAMGIKYKVKSFTVQIKHFNDSITTLENNGSRFTDEVRRNIRAMKSREKIRFTNIKAVGPDEVVKDVAPIIYKIR